MSRDSAVSTMTRLWALWSRNQSPL